jgi:hypothetical protein
MKYAGFLSIFLISVVSIANGEAFQRYEIKRNAEQVLLEGELRYYALSLYEYEAYTLRPQIGVEYTTNQHSFKVVLPYALTIYNNPQVEKRTYYGFEDIFLSYDYMKKVHNINFFFGGFWGIPLPQEKENLFTFGSGRHNVGLKFSLTGVRDPVVWNIGAQYGIGLPKDEGNYSSWDPGNIQVNMGITTLFNERFGLSLNLYQTVILPRVNNGNMKVEDLKVAILLLPEVLLMNENWYMRIGFDIYGYPMNIPVTVTITYGYTFDISGN